MKKLLLAFSVLMCFIACSSDSADYLTESQMEDVLYDEYLSASMDEEKNYEERKLRQITYHASILKKHGISEALWDSSFNYYCRHTETLLDIYQNVSERLRNDIIADGGDVADVGDGEFFSTGDTANVWTYERSFILVPNEPYNLRKYTIEVDSGYKAGDHLALNFGANFIFQDGLRDVACVFAVTLNNDSVVNVVRHVNPSDYVELAFDDNDLIGIKAIRCYFMLCRNMGESLSSTLRVAMISNIRLIRNHRDVKAMKEERQRKDSIDAARKDSIDRVIRQQQETP